MTTTQATVSGLYAFTATGTNDGAALNALLASVPAGSTVYLTDREIDVEETILISVPNTTLVGRGHGESATYSSTQGGTRLTWVGSAGGTVVEFNPNVSVTTTPDIRVGGGLRNLEIYGSESAGKALDIRSWNNLFVENCYIGAATETQINIQRKDSAVSGYYDRSAYLHFSRLSIYCPGRAVGASATALAGQPTITALDSTAGFTIGDTVILGYYLPDGTLVSESLVIQSFTSSTMTFTTNLTNSYYYNSGFYPDSSVSGPRLILDDGTQDADGIRFTLTFGVTLDDVSLRVVNGNGFRYIQCDDVFDRDTKVAIQGVGRSRLNESGASFRPSSTVSFGGFNQYQGGTRYEADDVYSTIGGFHVGLGTTDIGRPRIYADPGAVWGYLDDQGRAVTEPDIRISMPPAVDDFISGGTTSGTIGALGWTLLAGTASYIPSETDHPGILRLTTGTSTGDVAAIALGGAATGGVVLPDSGWDLIYVFRANDFTDTNIYIGLASELSFAGSPNGGPSEFIGFTRRSTDTWFAAKVFDGYVQQGATSNYDGTNRLLLAEDAWNRVRIRRRSTSAIGFTGGTALTADAPNFGIEARLSTGIPTAATWPIFYIRTATTAAKSIDIDVFRMTLKPVTR